MGGIMLEIIMREADEYRREHYGLLFESVGVLHTAGPGFYNRHHPHRVQIWRDASCTGGMDTHMLNAESIVIDNGQVERDPVIGDVRIGDTVVLISPTGERSTWMVDRRMLADPVLVPVQN